MQPGSIHRAGLASDGLAVAGRARTHTHTHARHPPDVFSHVHTLSLVLLRAVVSHPCHQLWVVDHPFHHLKNTGALEIPVSAVPGVYAYR